MKKIIQIIKSWFTIDKSQWCIQHDYYIFDKKTKLDVIIAEYELNNKRHLLELIVDDRILGDVLVRKQCLCCGKQVDELQDFLNQLTKKEEDLHNKSIQIQEIKTKNNW